MKSLLIRTGIPAFIIAGCSAGIIAAQAGPKPDAATQSTAQATHISASSPTASLKAYNLAMRAGDRGTMIALQHAERDEERHVARCTSESDLQVARAEQAARDKFGDAGGAQIAAALDDQDDAAIDAAQVKIDGDHADVTFQADGPPVRMIRDDGGWVVDVAAILKEFKGTPDELCDGIVRRGSVAKVTAQELTAGQFRTLAAAVDSVKGRLRDD